MATVEPILSALVSRARTPRSAKPMAPSRPRSWRRMSSDRGRRAAAGGLFSQDQPTRLLGDVNGDGRADIVGFGFAGTYTALGQADGTFAAPVLASNNFGTSPAAGGWASQDLYPRVVGDVNGDGRADILGFGFA